MKLKFYWICSSNYSFRPDIWFRHASFVWSLIYVVYRRSDSDSDGDSVVQQSYGKGKHSAGGTKDQQAA